MSSTIHKTTVLSMIERDIENKYAFLKQNSIQLLTSFSKSFPLLRVAIPNAEQWLGKQEKKYLPMVQDMVNVSVETCFADYNENYESEEDIADEVSINERYLEAKSLINKSIDELIKSKSSLSLDSIDQILISLIGTTLSI